MLSQTPRVLLSKKSWHPPGGRTVVLLRRHWFGLSGCVPVCVLGSHRVVNMLAHPRQCLVPRVPPAFLGVSSKGTEGLWWSTLSRWGKVAQNGDTSGRRSLGGLFPLTPREPSSPLGKWPVTLYASVGFVIKTGTFKFICVCVHTHV